VNEVGIGPDQLQAFLNGLCYSHQIVNSAISLPEPIYQADELAKRGKNNYATMKWVLSSIHLSYSILGKTTATTSPASLRSWWTTAP